MTLTIVLPQGLGVRSYDMEDQSFSEQLFFSTRESFNLLPLPRQQVELLLKQQFLLQQVGYSQTYPNAEILIVILDGEPIGKLILNHSVESLHIVDLVLSPNARSKGYGSAILRALKTVAIQKGLPLRLAVDQQNRRAKKLYMGLGFTSVESSETHDTLVWN